METAQGSKQDCYVTLFPPYFLFIFCGLLSQGNSMLRELGDAICLSEVARGEVYSNTWTFLLFLYM